MPSSAPAHTSSGVSPSRIACLVRSATLWIPSFRMRLRRCVSTVVVASYTRSNSDFAWATYQHLRDARLPVFPPVESRNLVVVLAGAAPTPGELAPVEAAIKALARDGKKKDYPDAYCARIDTLIPRPKQGQERP